MNPLQIGKATCTHDCEINAGYNVLTAPPELNKARKGSLFHYSESVHIGPTKKRDLEISHYAISRLRPTKQLEGDQSVWKART